MGEEGAFERLSREYNHRELYDRLGEWHSEVLLELLEGVDVLLAQGDYEAFAMLPDSEQRQRIEGVHQVIEVIRESLSKGES
jgi:hypothetical protein